MDKINHKQMFKIIIQNDKNKKRVFYTILDLGDFNHARPNLHKAIQDRIEPGFFSDKNEQNDYEVFWMDDENDIIIIQTWWDLHNYVSYVAPQGKNYLKLYVRSQGHQDRVEATKTIKGEQAEVTRFNLENTD